MHLYFFDAFIFFLMLLPLKCIFKGRNSSMKTHLSPTAVQKTIQLNNSHCCWLISLCLPMFVSQKRPKDMECASQSGKRPATNPTGTPTPKAKEKTSAGQISTAHSKRYLHGLATTHMFPSIFLRDVPHLRITIRLVANVCRTKFLDILWCLSCSLFSIWP